MVSQLSSLLVCTTFYFTVHGHGHTDDYTTSHYDDVAIIAMSLHEFFAVWF